MYNIDQCNTLIALAQQGDAGEAKIRAEHAEQYKLARALGRAWRVAQMLKRDTLNASRRTEFEFEFNGLLAEASKYVTDEARPLLTSLF